jgi:glycosyltransferase involved in cell wall biosynthesis
MTGGRRILFISPLDRRTVPNTREQNMAEACRASGHETLSLTLAQNTVRSPGAVLRDSLSWRVVRSDDGRVVCIDPPLNPCTGLESNLGPSKGGGGASFKAFVVRALSPLGVLRDLTIVPAFLLHALGHGRFDLCIAYGPWAACVGWWLRRLGRVGRLVYDDQDYEPAILRNRTRQRWAVFLERTMMRRADAVVSVGHRLAALRRSQTGRDVHVIPNGVPARSLLPLRVADPSAQRPFTLVYVGNLVPWSGLDVMLEGLPAVLAEGLPLRVVIVGDGSPPYVQGLHDRVAALGLQAVVELVGRVPHERIGDWLGQADVGLAHFRNEPYRRYAFPLKVIEYMAAGLAVIGTSDTETEDILARHGCGVAVACEPAAIATAILRLANDRVVLERCRSQAGQSAPAYLWSTLTEQALAVAGAVQAPQRREQTA